MKWMTFKRFKNMFFLWLANILPIQGHLRYKIVKFGGVNIKGPCFIYRNVTFDSLRPDLITIEKGVALTQGTIILTHYVNPSGTPCFRRGEVVIKENAFIGCNAIICNNVVIGEGAIIGAGSVVTKDVPPYQVWAGNPARYIKDRKRKE